MVSRSAQTSINSTSGEYPIVLLEINHSGLASPIRVCNDTVDITSNGQLYVAMPFRITLPDDFGEQMPKATLAMDNIGKELMTWLEASGGGQGATATIRQVMRAAPNTVEMEITMDLKNIAATWLEVSGSLGFDDILGRPAVTVQYRPETAPGLFS